MLLPGRIQTRSLLKTNRSRGPPRPMHRLRRRVGRAMPPRAPLHPSNQMHQRRYPLVSRRAAKLLTKGLLRPSASTSWLVTRCQVPRAPQTWLSSPHSSPFERGSEVKPADEVIVAEVERLRSLPGKWSWRRLARELEISEDALRRAVEPGYAERRNTMARERRNGEVRLVQRQNHVVETALALRQEGARRIAEIPPDTRNLTARLLGDPLPGRSALDRKARS